MLPKFHKNKPKTNRKQKHRSSDDRITDGQIDGNNDQLQLQTNPVMVQKNKQTKNKTKLIKHC